MSEVRFYNNQSPSGNLPREYNFFCKTVPSFQSFYASFGFSLLTQISRLRSTNLGSAPANQLNNLIDEALKIGFSEQIQECLTQLGVIISQIYQYDHATYEQWLAGYDGFYVAWGIRAILSYLFYCNNNPYYATVITNSGISSDDSIYFNYLASSLKIAIEVFYPNERKIYTEHSLESSKLMITMALVSYIPENEYAAVKHVNYDLFVDSNDEKYLNGVLVYRQEVSRAASGPGRQIPVSIPKAVTNPENPPAKESLSSLLNYLVEIIISRNWIFSIKQVEEIKPLLKKFSNNPRYQQKFTEIIKRMKGMNCEHSFENYAKFECGKFHCWGCIQDEIKLKTLLAHQIFCSCKKKLTDSEISYYFNLSLLDPVKKIDSFEISKPDFNPIHLQPPNLIGKNPLIKDPLPNQPALIKAPPGFNHSTNQPDVLKAPPGFNPSTNQPDSNKPPPGYNPSKIQSDTKPSPVVNHEPTGNIKNPYTNLPNPPNPPPFKNPPPVHQDFSKIPSFTNEKPPIDMIKSVAPPKLTFCTTCKKPVSQDDKLIHEGRIYHKGCQKQ